jgi:hypothetical protein
MEKNTFLNKVIDFIGPTNPSYLFLMYVGVFIGVSGLFIPAFSEDKMMIGFLGQLVFIFACYRYNKVTAQMMIINFIVLILLYLVMT